MELDRWRGSESEQHGELHETLAPVGKRSLTSRLGAPALVLRVEDVTVARALGEAIRGGRGPIQRDAEPGRDGNGVAANAEAAVERAASGSGEPLRADLRERFEASLGADLSAAVPIGCHPEEGRAARPYSVGCRPPSSVDPSQCVVPVAIESPRGDFLTGDHDAGCLADADASG